MPTPTLENLLTRADPPDDLSATLNLAPTLLATHARRRRTRRLLATATTTAALLLATLPLTRSRPPHPILAQSPGEKTVPGTVSPPPSASHPPPSAPSPTLAALDAAAAEHAALAEQLWKIERRARAAPRIPEPPIDPRPLAREQAAMALLSQADWTATADHDLAAARADYRQTIQLFPDTRAATLASARLQRLDAPQPQLNRSDTPDLHTPGKET